MRLMGGWILFSFSKRLLGLFFVILFSGCAKRADPIARDELGRLPYDELVHLKPTAQNEIQLFEKNFLKQEYLGACSFLNTLRQPQKIEDRFRVISYLGLDEFTK